MRRPGWSRGAVSRGSRRLERPARSIASLAFVALLAAAFWAGAAYVAEAMLNSGF